MGMAVIETDTVTQKILEGSLKRLGDLLKIYYERYHKFLDTTKKK